MVHTRQITFKHGHENFPFFTWSTVVDYAETWEILTFPRTTCASACHRHSQAMRDLGRWDVQLWSVTIIRRQRILVTDPLNRALLGFRTLKLAVRFPCMHHFWKKKKKHGALAIVVRALDGSWSSLPSGFTCLFVYLFISYTWPLTCIFYY